MATTKHTHTYTRLIRSIPRNLVIYNITALIIKIGRCSPGSALLSMRADAKFNSSTDAFTQKRKVVPTFTQKKKGKQMTTGPRTESARPFINQQERKTQRCLFPDSDAFTTCKSQR